MTTKIEAYFNAIETDVSDPTKSWADVVSGIEEREDE